MQIKGNFQMNLTVFDGFMLKKLFVCDKFR